MYVNVSWPVAPDTWDSRTPVGPYRQSCSPDEPVQVSVALIWRPFASPMPLSDAGAEGLTLPLNEVVLVVAVAVGSGGLVGVAVGVFVLVFVGTGVFVAVGIGVLVRVGVGVADGAAGAVAVGVAVAEGAAVLVAVAVLVLVDVPVALAVGVGDAPVAGHPIPAAAKAPQMLSRPHPYVESQPTGSRSVAPLYRNDAA